jgi:peptide/nickel transport system substrate-binding protein
MSGIPPDESLLRSGLTRRELLERSAALGAALSLPGYFGTAAASAGTDAVKPRRGGHLRVGMNDGGAGDSLAPWNIPIYSAAARAEQVYERLFKYDAHAVARPRLAESVESNAKGTIWRLKIRRGVTFHSGKPLTADDVLYSLRYIANPKNKAESLTRLEPLDLAASHKVSTLEVEFVLRRPIGDFRGLLAEKAVWIVPNGKTDFARKPDGTGPFKFVSWQPGIRAMFARNDHYWGIAHGDGPWVDSLEILDITDDTARVNALLGKQVDEIAFMPFVQAKAQAGNSAIQIVQAAQPQTNPIYVQMDRKPFTDNRIRLALKYAVDREAMVRQVELGFGAVGNDLFGKGYPSYNNELPQRKYDPEKAKSLLKQAGYDRFPFTLPTSNALPGMLESATAFKEQAKAANIDVTLEKLDAGSYFSNNKYLKVSSYQTNWGQSFESQAQDGMLRSSPYNETHWYNAQWAASFRKAQQITDTAKRNAAYKALQVPIWKTSGYVVFAFYNTVDAASSKVRGIVPNISSGFSNLGAFDFKDHWFAS